MPRGSAKTTKTNKTTAASTVKPSSTRTKKVSAETDSTLLTTPTSNSQLLKRYRFNKKTALAVLIIGLLLLVYYKKDWFVAATVNGQPITNLELMQKLYSADKESVLNQLINEKILMQAAQKAGVSVSPSEVNARVAQTEAQYGGAKAFNSLLTQQGLTMADFVEQTRIQLIVEKLYANEASPSAADVKKFMDDNKDSPEATDPAKFRATAIEQVRQQNLSNIFSQKFQQLKQAAKIQIF